MNYSLINDGNKSLSVIEQVFANRGIASKDIQHYLNTTEKDVLNPLLLDNMRDGTIMLIRHIKANDRAALIVDSDADGFTSAALLLNYLHRLFPTWTESVIHYLHQGKQHGLGDQDLDNLIAQGFKLVICPDSASNDYEQHAYLRERGVDVLVLDHHEAEKVSTDACIINNQLCDYPNKTLSGVGVVYKFCSYLDQLLNINQAQQFLDLVAVGIISDIMDLRNFETKYFITQGMNNIQNPYIQKRCEANAYSIGEELTPFGVAFYIAPFINAINRSGTFEEKLLTFESMLEFKAFEMIPSTKRGCAGQLETLVEQAVRIGNNVKNRQSRSEEASRNIIENIIEENNLLQNKLLIVTIPKEKMIDTAQTGLVANQIAAKYMRPTLILNETYRDGIARWEGSGRNFVNSPLLRFREFLINTGIPEMAQGHESAFGFSVKAECLSELIEKTNELLKDTDFSPKYFVDFIFDRSDGQKLKSTILELGELKRHWGQGLEEPLILVKGIKLTGDNIVLYDKGPTLKLTIPGDEGIEMLKFKSSEDEFNDLYSSSGCVELNVIGTCELNSWRGLTKPQITIKDYEIIGKTAYYF